MSPSSDPDDLELFREFISTRKRSLRNQIVERHLGLAFHIAKRFGGSGVAAEDMRQVALLGLIKAVDRFDPEFGAPFGPYAGQTIEGELKRHFRDRGWMVRVPRGAQDLHRLVRRATDELTPGLGRSPTVDEVASHLGLEKSDVLRGMAASAASHVESLEGRDAVGNGRPSGPRDGLATDESGYESVDDTSMIEALLAQLSEQQQEVVRLRFYGELSQADIAARVGTSQMQVSRILRQSFEQMREYAIIKSKDSRDDMAADHQEPG